MNHFAVATYYLPGPFWTESVQWTHISKHESVIGCKSNHLGIWRDCVANMSLVSMLNKSIFLIQKPHTRGVNNFGINDLAKDKIVNEKTIV